jgi:hypothetical protein
MSYSMLLSSGSVALSPAINLCPMLPKFFCKKKHFKIIRRVHIALKSSQICHAHEIQSLQHVSVTTRGRKSFQVDVVSSLRHSSGNALPVKTSARIIPENGESRKYVLYSGPRIRKGKLANTEFYFFFFHNWRF